jgi:hypothetical protein
MVGGIAMLTLACLSAPAFAQDPSDGPRHLSPGSVMIYPLFDSRPGFNTIITVTNTNTSFVQCPPTSFREGDVTVHYAYIESDTWLEFDLEEPLTPGDTLTVLARGHNREAKQGWLWVEARDPEVPDRAIDFDFLIGSAIVVNSDFNFEWEYAPYTFRALVEESGEDFGATSCGHFYADGGADEDDFTLDFDGVEYDFFPRTLFIDQFFGEGDPAELVGPQTFSNTLYLMSTEMLGTTVNFLFWNNNETRFSRGFQFDCWTEASLSEISSIALESNLRSRYDASELHGIPYGWVSFTSEDGLLGCFVQNISGAAGEVLAAGDALHFTGYREDVTIPRGN